MIDHYIFCTLPSSIGVTETANQCFSFQHNIVICLIGYLNFNTGCRATLQLNQSFMYFKTRWPWFFWIQLEQSRCSLIYSTSVCSSSD